MYAVIASITRIAYRFKTSHSTTSGEKKERCSLGKSSSSNQPYLRMTFSLSALTLRDLDMTSLRNGPRKLEVIWLYTGRVRIVASIKHRQRALPAILIKALDDHLPRSKMPVILRLVGKETAYQRKNLISAGWEARFENRKSYGLKGSEGASESTFSVVRAFVKLSSLCTQSLTSRHATVSSPRFSEAKVTNRLKPRAVNSVA